jgi:hypothetical protein
VLDDRQDVLALTGQRDRLDDVAGQQSVGLRTMEVGPGGRAALRRRVEVLGLEDLPGRRGGHLDSDSCEFAPGRIRIGATQVVLVSQPPARL